MKPNLQRCSIVMAGAWNQAIFSPEWVGEHLLDGSVSIELVFGPLGFMTQFVGPGVRLVVLPHQVQILCTTFEDAAAQLAEEVARRLLERLPETPVTAFGINWGFDVTEASAALDRLFSLSDEPSVTALGGQVVTTTIARKMLLGEREITIALTRKTPTLVTLDFNHQVLVKNAREAASKIAQSVLPSRDTSMLIARDVYGVKVSS